MKGIGKIKRLAFLSVVSCLCFTNIHLNNNVGDPIDYYNGVEVYYNGKVANVHGRHLTKGGYNLGLKWQCVEFVKRYYLQIFDHYMPNSYGHAKDFFDKSLADKEYNYKRALIQYRNIRKYKPKVDDILIYDGDKANPFGHMGIISEVCENEIEIVQQNYGQKTRQRIQLVEYNGIYTVADFNVLGWLRMPY